MAAMSIVFCVSWDCVKTKNTVKFYRSSAVEAAMFLSQ